MFERIRSTLAVGRQPYPIDSQNLHRAAARYFGSGFGGRRWNGRSRNFRLEPASTASSGCSPGKCLRRTFRPPCFAFFRRALTNVARHAQATRVEVVKQKQRDRLVLWIRDNGRGFDPADPSRSGSLGLLGMRERAAMLGGGLSISSAPGKGPPSPPGCRSRRRQESGIQSHDTSPDRRRPRDCAAWFEGAAFR